MAMQAPKRRILQSVNRWMDAVEPELVEVFRALVLGKAPWPLYLHGAPGRGKTFASLSLCDRAKTACYETIEGLCDATMNHDEELYGRWEAIQARELAILDEIGCRQQVGDLHYAIVKRFADLRELHAGRIAVYVSNIGPNDVPALYDGRLASRLLCGTWYELKGKDRRVST